LASFFGLFPFFRPLGIFGQPQKSAFIAAAGIVAYYYLSQIEGKPMRRSRSYLVCIYFVLSGVVTGGTTGILASLFVLAIVYGAEFGVVVSSLLVAGSMIALVVAIYFVIEHPLYYNAFANDLSGLFGGSTWELAFGNGFVTAEDLFKDGFGHEHFIFRVIYEVGLLPFICWNTLLIFEIFRAGFTRAGKVLLVLLLFMVAHYSVTNVYFMVVFFCVCLRLLPTVAKAER
jgi:hypothetical protein